MELKRLVDVRREAEKAVSDMPEGELKVKAFEVILNSLISVPMNPETGDNVIRTTGTPSRKGPEKRQSKPTSTRDRILLLNEEDYFREQRSIAEIRQKLAVRGWHYPQTALSGPLQDLVQRRELRRQKLPDGKKRVWKYSNP
jgi:hypothetical protein